MMNLFNLFKVARVEGEVVAEPLPNFDRQMVIIENVRLDEEDNTDEETVK